MTGKTSLAAMFIAAMAAMPAFADTYIYTVGWFGFNQEGRIEGGTDSAIICGGGLCIPIANCSACHAQPVEPAAFGRDPAMKHQRIYFPKLAFKLADGQKASLGTTVVARVNGVLELQEPKGRRFRLPQDAYIVAGRDGKPLLITYQGRSPPQMLR